MSTPERFAGVPAGVDGVAGTRRLRWPACRNVRDLGGLPTADGGAIRPGALIRADGLSRLTTRGTAALRAAGVSRVLDLRRERERAAAPDPFVGEELYRAMPVQEPADPDDGELALPQIYCTQLDRRPRRYAAVLAAVLAAPDGAVVVHCAGGKDRTGLVSALALTVAGVAPDVVAADYALSEGCLQEVDAPDLAAIADPVERERRRELRRTRPATMLAVLDHLGARWGGVAGYLAFGGFAAAGQRALRDRLR